MRMVPEMPGRTAQSRAGNRPRPQHIQAAAAQSTTRKWQSGGASQKCITIKWVCQGWMTRHEHADAHYSRHQNRSGNASTSIEQSPQKTASMAGAMTRLLMAAAMFTPTMVFTTSCRNAGIHVGLRRHGVALALFNDFVQLSSVQPYAPALRAVIDFDVLAMAHRKLNGFASGALHEDSFL